ncbi:MAG: hypothetical protein IKD30_06990, partial [Peptococcaceae bacterium]|nr:hypothetical protein [Peptococcaceae bacterium]
NQLLIMNFDFQYFEKYFPGLRKMFFPSIISDTDDYLRDANIKLKEQIAQLDTEQLFFIEQFIRQIRITRKQEVFQQWQHTLHNLVNNT